MRRIALVLLAVSLPLAAACGGAGGDDDDDDGGTPGSIILSAGCAGAACGLSGTLHIPVREENCAAPVLLTVTVPGVVTSAGNPIVHELTLERAFYCVDAWLDVDTSGTVTQGDAVPSAAPGVAQAGPGTPVSVTLDTLHP